MTARDRLKSWWRRALGSVGRSFWVSRIDAVLHRAYRAGLIDSWLLHELDARLECYTDRDFERRSR